jgi:hypothetical protein
MCGDLDEEDRLESALHTRFRGHARTLLKGRSEAGSAAAGDLPAYLDGLFADALQRCLRDTDSVAEERRYEMLAAQPIVFARLAGFLAAHASVHDDPLRKVIEALMHGYSEAEAMEAAHGHDHHEQDGHDHCHSHDHHH